MYPIILKKSEMHTNQNITLTLFTMGFFGTAHEWGGDKKTPSLKSVTHILQ